MKHTGCSREKAGDSSTYLVGFEPSKPMSVKDSSEEKSTAQQTRLLLDGVSRSDLTKEFVVGIQELAENEGLSVESVSVGEA